MAVIRANGQTLRKLLVVAVAMFGFGYALVPFYKKICEVTGINNLQNADAVVNTQADLNRTVTLELDANIRNDLPWTFRPVVSSVRIHPGQVTQVVYEVHNNSDQFISGQAIPSYGPQLAGKYFRKLDCFCFAKQDFKPREVRKMPVTFVLQNELPADVNTITLSYTFFRVEGPVKPAAAAVAREPKTAS